MKFISRDQAERIELDGFSAREYEFGDPSINIARIKLQGRYPAAGWASNTLSKECCYVLDGSAVLTFEDGVFELEAGDACVIEPQERYFWEADATFIIASTPPWTKEQARQEP